jgi:cytochrome d ubiquinol oxidase subunit I
MNTPDGFVLQGARATRIDPIAALLNRSTLSEGLHMTLAAYAATGFAVAGTHAILLRRDKTNRFHRRALAIALVVGGLASLAQPLSGDYAAKVVARTQPVKLAAMEGQFLTQSRAPLRIGGLPDPNSGQTKFALEIPGGLSLLAYGDRDAVVKGLNDVPKLDRPPVRVVHVAFQVMVACGMAMAAVALWAAIAAWRCRGVPDGPRFLTIVALSSPLGMLAIEAGWTVTEVGRQPWIVQGVIRTKEAVTPVKGIEISMICYIAIYLVLGLAVVSLLLSQFRSSPGYDELGTPGRGGK